MQRTILLMCILLCLACSGRKEKRAVELYASHCASCHKAPEINNLPRDIWESSVLPDMAARMGIRDSTYNPFAGLSYREYEAVVNSGIYPLKPTISREDWELLQHYILKNAPEEMPVSDSSNDLEYLTQFEASPISLDSIPGSFFTFLQFDEQTANLILGDMSGELLNYNFKNESLTIVDQYETALVDFSVSQGSTYATSMGNMNPSQLPVGSLVISKDELGIEALQKLHRPVHTLVTDLNEDGSDEIIVSEFGHHSGSLSLFVKSDSSEYEKRVLLNRSGIVRTIAKDLDGDGKRDLAVLAAQGREEVVFLYQRSGLNFELDQKLEFSPLYGSSWFELIDYDGDGDLDIISVHGDNADKSYVPKPYHGMRIYINENGSFNEKYFYALNGATRMVAQDFDEDGDLDFALVATFPDYSKNKILSFVYLENKDSESFRFAPFALDNAKLGRWFLIDAADIDEDGDKDIVLSSFTYSFTPVPDSLSKVWEEKDADIMILRNKLN